MEEISEGLTTKFLALLSELNQAKVSRILIEEPSLSYNHKQRVLRHMLKAVLLFDYGHSCCPESSLVLKTVVFEWEREEFY